MSNLKLPTMSYESLFKLAPTNGDWKKIAYATFVRRGTIGGSVIQVKHHETVIANLTKEFFEIHNGGYNTPTTANRLNRIVRDNGITDRWVGIKQYSMRVSDKDGKTVTEMFPVTFQRN